MFNCFHKPCKQDILPPQWSEVRAAPPQHVSVVGSSVGTPAGSWVGAGTQPCWGRNLREGLAAGHRSWCNHLAMCVTKVKVTTYMIKVKYE